MIFDIYTSLSLQDINGLLTWLKRVSSRYNIYFLYRYCVIFLKLEEISYNIVLTDKICTRNNYKQNVP